MNNKDIQTLIEREANSYAVSNIDNPKSLFTHLSKQTQDDIFDTVDSSFQAGASFALSIFKWRKVSEELPEMAIDCKTDHAMDRKSDRVLIKTKHGFDVAVYNYYFEDFIANAMAVEGVTEWMPIPQID